MTNELLKTYFERTCSEREAAIVEDWLIEPQNQQTFERFLESYWQEHVDEQSALSATPAPKEISKEAVRRYLPRLVAAAAVLSFVIAGSYYFFTKETESQKKQPVAKIIEKPQPAEEHVGSATVIANAEKINVHQSKTKQHGKKLSPVPALVNEPVVVADTVASKPKTVKMSTMSKVMINEVALNKLDSSEQLKVLNQMALNVNINNASFNEIAAILQKKYGIVLELCATSQPEAAGKNYTAHFAQVSFPELMDDMSKQMLFSYTITDKKTVKVCFN